MEKWVVVVDDDIIQLKKAGTVLSENGIHTTAVRTGKALFEFLRTHKPDLILLDMLMPEMDGLEVLRRLRTDPGPAGNIPVIMVSGDEHPETREACQQLGAADFLQKPWRNEQLVRRVREMLERDALPETPQEEKGNSGRTNLETAAQILEKMDEPLGRAWMGREELTNTYRYMLRYMERYQGYAYQVLFTVEPIHRDVPREERSRLTRAFRKSLQQLLRSSDMLFEFGENQLFLLLPEVHDFDIDRVISRLMEIWHRSEVSREAAVTYESREVRSDRRSSETDRVTYSVAVVDDDPVNLKMAERALEAEDFRVTALNSGEALLEHLAYHQPDLILLDILMPGMDGFETLRKIREKHRDMSNVPVIFMTADDNRETETQGLQLGATDFVRKPFLPDVLALRVRHMAELSRLQQHLTQEVDRKTKENASLSLRVVQALARAIDAKDTYTNGHSGRVADYARRIAERCGYSSQRQNEIYLAGLLHDVGKIGVPDYIINKPGRLTPEEYDLIKTHPAIGEEILESIRERPELAIGARWHHERFDGTGYPDGLAGNAIPEIARIIAVADAYDAMTSRRSYRDNLAPEQVRAELEKGKGTQFDPAFADIMLSIMDGEYSGTEAGK